MLCGNVPVNTMKNVDLWGINVFRIHKYVFIQITCNNSKKQTGLLSEIEVWQNNVLNSSAAFSPQQSIYVMKSLPAHEGKLLPLMKTMRRDWKQQKKQVMQSQQKRETNKAWKLNANSW